MATNAPDPILFQTWKRLVNMTEDELEAFYAVFGRHAGLSRTEAKHAGVRSGRDSARALLRMMPYRQSFRRAEDYWTPTDWEWARRQVAFIRRMRGVRGPLWTETHEPTRKLLALLLWGHDPTRWAGHGRNALVTASLGFL